MKDCIICRRSLPDDQFTTYQEDIGICDRCWKVVDFHVGFPDPSEPCDCNLCKLKDKLMKVK